jgi:DNA-binding transcriptional ArsR family regulator
VLRLLFTVEDLARVRVVAGLGPVAESVFGLDLFGRRETLNGQWRKDVRARLGDRLAGVTKLVDTCSPVPELLWMAERPVATGQAPKHTDPAREQVAATVFEFCRAAVAPYWDQARGCLEEHRDVRARTTVANGVQWLLTTLHPAARWVPPVLEVPSRTDRDVVLAGRGLLLSPALFLHDRTCALIEPTRGSGQPVLAFPAHFDAIARPHHAEDGAAGDRALGALVGHTRAAALRALADSCTTSELSDRLGISLAGASKHAAVLREAGLITTTRQRNTVLHILTPLGTALLRKLDTGAR